MKRSDIAERVGIAMPEQNEVMLLICILRVSIKAVYKEAALSCIDPGPPGRLPPEMPLIR